MGARHDDEIDRASGLGVDRMARGNIDFSCLKVFYVVLIRELSYIGVTLCVPMYVCAFHCTCT